MRLFTSASPANTSSKLLFDDRLLGIFFLHQNMFSRTALVMLEKPLINFSVQKLHLVLNHSFLYSPLSLKALMYSHVFEHKMLT